MTPTEWEILRKWLIAMLIEQLDQDLIHQEEERLKAARRIRDMWESRMRPAVRNEFRAAWNLDKRLN